ncbi:T9SS type A sorting domain-containing protein [Aurantibacillus circumpalustris]|uniref:T9SS type A sorting domain-containing protein n=1 Tax=Aurantibacillus circumpalustris TaxID=3036359 RepID=UPI00295A9563|nr:T9SS type A sorting domain-containing protein [Aurantibacillus circumpalustris]
MRFLITCFIIVSAFVLSAQVNKNTFAINKAGIVNVEAASNEQPLNKEVIEMPKQGLSYASTNKTHFVHPKRSTINYSAITNDFAPSLMVKEMPRQGSKKMVVYNYSNTPTSSNLRSSATQSVLPDLVKLQSFFGNNWGISTPNDNDMAISDSGIIVSVINTNIYIRNSVTNSVSPAKSLAGFTSPINSKHQEFDPKVMYDPSTDRFVLVCLVGSTDSTSKIIVGFTQTNNPNGNWNLYTLPGDPLNYGLWSDYPMIAMTDKELFLSVNLLYNDSTWQAGFVETLVWQINKGNGYDGVALNSDLHSNIKFNGKAIRNLCPVKGGSHLYSPNMYFVSNRNLASQNDTVFLVNITDTIGSPTGTVTTKAMVSDQPYYFPNDGRQTISSQSLATNDCRNLGAFYENGIIQYVHNTNNPLNSHSTIYYGTISNLQTTTPVVNGYILPNDTMDFAYPNISYAGNSNTDNTSIISFNHSSDKVFTGCSAVRADGLGNFSPILRIQNGTTYVNLLTSNLERWGDYSGSQRKYNSPGEVWMSGYQGRFYNGNFPNAHVAWIAQIKTDTSTAYLVGVENKNKSLSNTSVYPNPARDIFSVEVSLTKPEYLSFELLDPQGKLIEVLLRDWVTVKENLFSFNTTGLSKGVYFLKISGNNNTSIIKKIIIN